MFVHMWAWLWYAGHVGVSSRGRIISTISAPLGMKGCYTIPRLPTYLSCSSSWHGILFFPPRPSSLSLSPSAHLYRSSPPPAHHNINSPFASLSRPSRSLSVFASAPGGVRALLTMRSDWFLLAFHLSPSYALPSLRSLPRPSLLPPLSPSPLRLLIPTVLITPEGPSHERTFPPLCGFTI